MHPSGISDSVAFALDLMDFFVIVTPFIVRKFFIIMWLIIQLQRYKIFGKEP